VGEENRELRDFRTTCSEIDFQQRKGEGRLSDFFPGGEIRGRVEERDGVGARWPRGTDKVTTAGEAGGTQEEKGEGEKGLSLTSIVPYLEKKPDL